MKKLLLVGMMLLGFLQPSHAQTTASCQNSTYTLAPGVALYCTATWQFVGLCNSTDYVYSWAINGTTNPGTWHILPWEPNAITIRNVELTKVSGGPNLWFMPGNAYVPDAMGHMSASRDYMFYEFPAGSGMPFPSNVSPPANAYLDLHGGCTGGGSVVLFYTVGYTVP